MLLFWQLILVFFYMLLFKKKKEEEDGDTRTEYEVNLHKRGEDVLYGFTEISSHLA